MSWISAEEKSVNISGKSFSGILQVIFSNSIKMAEGIG